MTITTNTIHEAAEYLRKSPVYAMSLGSKELFHSNFWAWLIESDHRYAGVFFPEIDTDAIKKVLRESKNRDLAIVMKDKKEYIIENKLKSIPYAEQLKNYADKTGDNFAGGLLTGIISCELPGKWAFKDYEAIGKEIEALAMEIEEDPFRKNLIAEYANVIQRTCLLIKELVGTTHKDRFIFGDITEVWGETLRLDDIVKKLQAENLKKYICYHIADELKEQAPEQAEFIVDCDFSNKEAMVNVVYKTEAYHIAITIQGNKFRRVLSTDASAEEIFKRGLKMGYFEEFNGKTVCGKATAMTKDYCQFKDLSKKKLLHIYQYWNITDATFSALADEIRENMTEAAKCIGRCE